MKQKNILFLIFAVFIMSLLVCYNYFFTVYSFSHSNKFFFISDSEKRYLNIYIDNNKHIKNDTIIVGSSEILSLFPWKDLLGNFANCIYAPLMSGESIYNVTKYYIEQHPETRKVYFFICYSSFLFEIWQIGEDFHIDTKKERLIKYTELLFSSTQLKKQIDKLITRHTKSDDEFICYPFKNAKLDTFDKTKKRYNDYIEYIDKLMQFLKEKNIECEFYIPPYTTTLMAIIYNNPEYYKLITDLKRHVVNYPGGRPIYDYSIINELNNQNLLDGTNIFWADVIHIKWLIGLKVLKQIFFDTRDNDYDNLYIRHSKENIDKTLLMQTNQLAQFMKDSEIYINTYNKLLKQLPEDYKIYTNVSHYKDILQEFDKDSNFLWNNLPKQAENK